MVVGGRMGVWFSHGLKVTANEKVNENGFVCTYGF